MSRFGIRGCALAGALLIFGCAGSLAQVAKESPAVSKVENGAGNVQPESHFDTMACQECHDDPHGFYTSTKPSCKSCHSHPKWNALLPFDHSRVSVQLAGAHKELAGVLECSQCHSTTKKGYPLFSEGAIRCSGCHEEQEPHGGQFRGPEGETKECSSCHVPKAWAAPAFDHNRARFTMDAAHREVSCTKCHKEQKVVSGRNVRLYRGTPDDCLKCH